MHHVNTSLHLPGGRAPALLLVSMLLAAVLPGTAGAVEINKWVDKDGVTHYGDKVPPEAAPLEKQKLNRNGVVTEVQPAEPTPEELRERKRLEEQRLAREAQEQREREYLENLFKSYASEADLERFHRGQMDALYLRQRSNDRKLQQLRIELRKLEEKASNYNFPYTPDSDLPDIPSDLVEDLLLTNQALREREADAENLRQSIDAQADRLEKDLALYRESTAQAKAQEVP